MSTITLTKKVKMATAKPTQKVTAGSFALALSTIVVFVLNTYVLPSNQPLPAEVSLAIMTIVTFLVMYFVPPSSNDGLVDA